MNTSNAILKQIDTAEELATAAAAAQAAGEEKKAEYEASKKAVAKLVDEIRTRIAGGESTGDNCYDMVILAQRTTEKTQMYEVLCWLMNELRDHAGEMIMVAEYPGNRHDVVGPIPGHVHFEIPGIVQNPNQYISTLRISSRSSRSPFGPIDMPMTYVSRKHTRLEYVQGCFVIGDAAFTSWLASHKPHISHAHWLKAKRQGREFPLNPELEAFQLEKYEDTVLQIQRLSQEYDTLVKTKRTYQDRPQMALENRNKYPIDLHTQDDGVKLVFTGLNAEIERTAKSLKHHLKTAIQTYGFTQSNTVKIALTRLGLSVEFFLDE